MANLLPDTISFGPVGSLPVGFSFFDPTGPGSGSAVIQSKTSGAMFLEHNWLLFSTGESVVAAALNTPILLRGLTIYFGWKSEGFSMQGPMVEMFSYPADPSEDLFINFFLNIEPDNTVSFFVAGSPSTRFWNSGVVPFSMYPNVWYFYQLTLTYQFNSDNVFQVVASLIVDGELLADGITGTSNFYTTGSFTGASGHVPGDPGVNFVSWQQPGDGPIGLSDPGASGPISTPNLLLGLWDFVIDNPGSDYGPLPPTINITTPGGNNSAQLIAVLDAMPGMTGPIGSLIAVDLGSGYTLTDVPIIITATPFGSPNGVDFAAHGIPMPNAFQRESQQITEYSFSNPNVSLRNSQDTVEYSHTNPNRGIRIAQMVIEWPPNKNGPPPGGGNIWRVKEI